MKKCRQKDGGFWPLLTPYGSSHRDYKRIESASRDESRDKLNKSNGGQI